MRRSRHGIAQVERGGASIRHKVFAGSVRYDAVSISDTAIDGQVITTHFDGAFTIRWGTGFRDIMGDEGRKATFIHEMTHVWQGCNNGAWSGTYQAKSAYAQLKEGLRDIIRKDDYANGIRNWDRHRSTAYKLYSRRFGEPWSNFNVEQQGMIVETWYIEEALRRRHTGDAGPGVFGAAMSPYDARFPFIRDVNSQTKPDCGLPTGDIAARRRSADQGDAGQAGRTRLPVRQPSRWSDRTDAQRHPGCRQGVSGTQRAQTGSRPGRCA